ncbi:hypothetical protein VULLAG_LOCUS15319 [Vulpes lagopus]
MTTMASCRSRITLGAQNLSPSMIINGEKKQLDMLLFLATLEHFFDTAVSCGEQLNTEIQKGTEKIMDETSTTNFKETQNTE